jgi:hypothetical protein
MDPVLAGVHAKNDTLPIFRGIKGVGAGLSLQRIRLWRFAGQPRHRRPRLVHLRLQLGIGVLPEIDELAVVAFRLVAVAEGLVELAEAAEDEGVSDELRLQCEWPQNGNRNRTLTRNRSAPIKAASSGRSTLSATRRWWRRSSARYTIAIPPRPSSRSIR